MGPGPAARLRIYIRYDDVAGDIPLADALVYKAQERGLAAAIALRGIIGADRGDAPRPTELIIARNLPVVVEIVDRREQIDAYLAAVAAMLRGGLVTIEPVEVLRYENATNAQA
jgi:uncharacterized protein